MGAGTLKLYNSDKTRVIGKRSNYAAYKHDGKCYMIDGSAWTGWTRHQISKRDYNKIIKWAADNAETYEFDRIFKPTQLQLAARTLRVTPPYTIKRILGKE